MGQKRGLNKENIVWGTCKAMSVLFVILVNYNGIDDTLDCIASILSAGLDEYSIIVVDNASKKDETIEIRDKFPGVVTIRNEINGGFSTGNNIGIRYALAHGADYVMLLNNDTVIAPDMISLLSASCNDDVITVPKMFYYFQPDKIWYGGGEINRWTGNVKHCCFNQVNVLQNRRFCTFATGCCMMIKADIFNRIGLLDERYFMYSEDVDFSIRLLNGGIKIEYIPQAELWHKAGSSSGGKLSPFSTYYITRNRLGLIKNYRYFFHWTAYWYSLITRYIRMFQTRDKDVKEAFKKGINDSRMGCWRKTYER